MYFSVHDLESTWARIAVVNSAGHEHKEGDFSGEHQEVVQEGLAVAMPHTHIRTWVPYGLDLQFNVSAARLLYLISTEANNTSITPGER
jgi:hypothetical protein